MPVKRANATGSPSQKRTRFASPSPAAEGSNSLDRDVNVDLLEEDLQQGSSRIKNRERRKLKDQSGYGSDSSNDEESVVPGRGAATKADDEGDVDMFGDDLNEDKDEMTGKDGALKDKKGKGKEFLELGDIEGQELDGIREGGADMSDSEDEGEEDDETGGDERIGRKKAKEKDLGFEITPFNMKGEMEEGRFTADGEAYVENERDPGDKHDMWLENLDKEEIRKARKAHKERERVEAERIKREAEAQGGGETGKEEERLMRLAVGLMERGETVLEALQRLGKEEEERKRKEESGKKKSWVERQKERKALERDGPTVTPFITLSNIVSALTAIGHLDVYSLSRESLQRLLPAASEAPAGTAIGNGAASPAPARPVAPADNRQFQYRFSLAYVRNLPESQRPVERDTFGPFTAQQLQQWRNTGAFGGPACENVELRLAGEDGAAWGSWADTVGA